MATKPATNRNHVANHPTETPSPSDKLDFKRQLTLTVVTACLTLLGTLLGIGINQHIQQGQWSREKAYTIESDLLSRRLALMDRFLKVSRRDAELSTLKLLVQNNVDEVSQALKQKNVEVSYKLIREGEDDTRRLDEGRAEYLAVLTLSAAMFGPKTQHAIQMIVKNHNPNVWEADEQEKNTMVEAMSAELGWGLPDVPISTNQSFSTAP
jgi:hypothetical protein